MSLSINEVINRLPDAPQWFSRPCHHYFERKAPKFDRDRIIIGGIGFAFAVIAIDLVDVFTTELIQVMTIEPTVLAVFLIAASAVGAIACLVTSINMISYAVNPPIDHQDEQRTEASQLRLSVV